MKKLLILALAALPLLGITSCKSTPKGPEEIAKKAIEAIQSGNYDEYVATFNLSEEDQQALSALLKEKVSESIKEKGGIASHKITECEIEDNKATGDVKIKYKNGTEEDQKMFFEKVGDEWKKVLNK